MIEKTAADLAREARFGTDATITQLKAKITELASDYRDRKYNYPSDRLGPEDVARNDGKEDAFSEVADDLDAILKLVTPNPRSKMEQMFTKADVQKMIGAAVDYTFNLTDHTFHSEFADPNQAARVDDLKPGCVETVMRGFEQAQQVFG